MGRNTAEHERKARSASWHGWRDFMQVPLSCKLAQKIPIVVVHHVLFLRLGHIRPTRARTRRGRPAGHQRGHVLVLVLGQHRRDAGAGLDPGVSARLGSRVGAQLESEFGSGSGDVLGEGGGDGGVGSACSGGGGGLGGDEFGGGSADPPHTRELDSYLPIGARDDRVDHTIGARL